MEKLLIKYQISLIFESSIEMKVFIIEFGRLLKLLVSWALGLTPHEKTLFSNEVGAPTYFYLYHIRNLRIICAYVSTSQNI